MATLANLENLMTAYDAVGRAQFVEWNGSRETSPARLGGPHEEPTKRAAPLSFGERNRLPANWHGLCEQEACIRNANYQVEGVKLCAAHAKDAALRILCQEDAPCQPGK
jgi:hypothetical protein